VRCGVSSPHLCADRVARARGFDAVHVPFQGVAPALRATAANPAMVAEHDIVIIGAGPAGLAVAGCLVQRGLRPLVIEKGGAVAASWRAHYERLHLHTVKTLSALPGVPYPTGAPRYVPRQGVVDYLVSYAAQHAITPQFSEEVVSITPVAGAWGVTSALGRQWRSRAVVLATGANCLPRLPVFEGRNGYTGRVLHSHAYHNALPFTGRDVLVVGMGNTGAEIALDLAEHGVRAALSVRSPINIVHRDVLGRPTQLTSIALSHLPTAWGDALAGWLRNLTVGDLRRWGLQTSTVSPLRQLREHGKTPVIDVGTLARIKRGEIVVHPGIERFTAKGVRFADGSEEDFDAVILATGYEAQVQRLFPTTAVSTDFTGMPRDMVGEGATRGIYFVGFDIRQPGGLLRAISAQAQHVARVIFDRSALREPAGET
jgi:cation diffusion facilitator CzcD-associated flavoprotein CzcO